MIKFDIYTGNNEDYCSSCDISLNKKQCIRMILEDNDKNIFDVTLLCRNCTKQLAVFLEDHKSEILTM